jgi:hypothetical protein
MDEYEDFRDEVRQGGRVMLRHVNEFFGEKSPLRLMG